MAAATAARSRAGSRVQTSGFVFGRMAFPPCGGNSLEGGDQLGNGAVSQDGGRRPRTHGPIGALDGDIADLAGMKFDLAMANMAGEQGESNQLEDPAVERMSRVVDRDLPLAQFGDQRGITLAGLCRFRGCR